MFWVNEIYAHMHIGNRHQRHWWICFSIWATWQCFNGTGSTTSWCRPGGSLQSPTRVGPAHGMRLPSSMSIPPWPTWIILLAGHRAVLLSSVSTSTVYWCIASKIKAARNLYWMSNMFLWVEIFLFFVCYHVFPKRHSQLDYKLNDL